MAGFDSPKDFSHEHKAAFKSSLVSASSILTSTDQVMNVNATANRRRRALLGSSVTVGFTISIILDDFNYTTPAGDNSTTAAASAALVILLHTPYVERVPLLLIKYAPSNTTL